MKPVFRRYIYIYIDIDIELLQLRGEAHEEKCKEYDAKIKAEIERQTTSHTRIAVLKLWEQDCRRNEEISRKRWESRNLPWLNKYEEEFKRKHANTNRFINQPESQISSYAQVTSQQNSTRRETQTNTTARNTTDWQTVNAARRNQRRNQYRENTGRSQSRERRYRYTSSPRNTIQEERIPTQRAQNQYQDSNRT